jgi:hypothetical protein
MKSEMDLYQEQGVKAGRGNRSESSGKFYDQGVNKTALNPEKVIKGKRTGGSKISRVIAMDYDTYHKTKGGIRG